MTEQHETFSLEILTPEKPFLIKETTLVVVPSREGDFGAMAGIAPLLCALRAGVVCLFNEKLEAVERYFVPGGTAWVTRERAVLLVSEVLELTRIDPHATRAEILKLEAQENLDEQTAFQLEVLRQKYSSVRNIPYA